MTPEQNQHLQTVLAHFEYEATEKYMNGQAEHGGNLFELPLLELIREAKKEAIDQYIYLDTAEQKVKAFLAKYGIVDKPIDRKP
jgi:predicted PolB exonuclease-like 3'-5' exonuclease